MVAGELPDLPHLPELPGRGDRRRHGRPDRGAAPRPARRRPALRLAARRPAGDGRAARPRLPRPGPRRARGAHQGLVGPVKLQVAGPWTLAAALALPRGEPVLSDAGALRDLVAVADRGRWSRTSADVRRRLPGADRSVQLDEPSLPAVLAGGSAVVLGRAHLPGRPRDRRRGRAARRWSTRSACRSSCTAARPARRSRLVRRSGARGLSRWT